MKKALVIVIIVVGVLGYLVYDALTPESVKIRRQMSDILNDKGKPRQIAMIEYDRLRYPLAQEYIAEKKPDDAIKLLIEMIKVHQNPINIFGQKRPKISADYYFEARYYEELSKAFYLKGDIASQEKALKKSQASQVMHERLDPIEKERERRNQQKEQDAILK